MSGSRAGQRAPFDSVAGLNSNLAIENEFEITVEGEHIEPKNFAAPSAIASYVERKLKES